MVPRLMRDSTRSAGVFGVSTFFQIEGMWMDVGDSTIPRGECDQKISA